MLWMNWKYTKDLAKNLGITEKQINDFLDAKENDD
jgi:plasmid maintenance system antidote protein VapI